MKAKLIKKIIELLNVSLFLLFCILGTLLVDGWQAYRFAPSKSAMLTIKPGTSLQGIANSLKQKNLIASKFYFEWIVRLLFSEISLKAGEYEIPQGISLKNLLFLLHEGKSIHYSLTIPEGFTSQEITALLSREEKLEGNLQSLPDEGSLLPETYHYHRPQTRKDLLKRMSNAQKKLLQNLWAGRSNAFLFKTPHEVIILASIVERETSLASERRHIAGVFINRLKMGMPLQSDPTVRYGLYQQKGTPFEGRLYRKHLKIETPYNTYLNQGLPPGPICHPGRASIEAIFDPLETDDLYFVADGKGGHHFSSTYAQHKKHHQEWRKLRHERSKK